MATDEYRVGCISYPIKVAGSIGPIQTDVKQSLVQFINNIFINLVEIMYTIMYAQV